MTADSDGFLGRWARRKALARSGAELPPEPEPASPAAPLSAAGRPLVLAGADSAALPAPEVAAPPPAPAEPEPPAPTLADAQQLTPASDFRPFVARAVAPEVRNAAFRKLFADPHFNLMDGLDIYIDDYSRPDPLPLAVARELLAAQFPRQPAERALQDAAVPACEAQAAAAAGADQAPVPDASLPRAQAARNGTGPSAGAEPASTDGARRDHLSTDPQE